MSPRIIVNAKVYPQVTGEEAVLRLAQACQAVAEESGVPIGLAPPMVELGSLARRADLPAVHVFSQHADPLAPGSGTGHTTLEAIQATGAVGTLVNHAEHKVPHDHVQEVITRARRLDLETLVCADGMAETRALADMHPSYLAVEPPALIGGDTSVTTADPAIVSDAAEAVRAVAPGTKTLCGAGVKTGRDVSAALELGAYGVLLASGVVKADDPVGALRDLASGL